MSKMILTSEMIEAAVVGGCVLGGGGGGSMKEGINTASKALEGRTLDLIDGEDLNDDDIVINVSAVGAPSAKTMYVTEEDYGTSVDMLCKFADIKAAGVITNEAGGLATVNGWLQAALLGLPVVDLPSNGRAHPTGIMGAMGLHREEGYMSVQAAVGGDPKFGRRVEIVTKSTIENASSLIRSSAVLAGGFVVVARNPVTVAYAKKNAATGAIKQAIALGQSMIEARDKGGDAVLEAVCKELGGEILHKGKVKNVNLECKGGFDVGTVEWDDFELTFWNEYMTVEKNGERLGTFPDLIMTLDANTGWPVTSAEIAADTDIAILYVPAANLHLGAGMHDPELYKACENAVEKEIIKYAFK